jgi:predicted ATPase/class 3 adenylate cyclase
MAPDEAVKRDVPLRQWLGSLGLEQYAQSFERNDVGLDVLNDLGDGDLEKLGVTLGDRKRLLRAIAGLQSKNSRPAAENSRAISTHELEAERRQLTVLFCDLAGSTQLSQQLDPEDLRSLMQAYQRTCSEIVARYEGHVAQYLGDGLMVYFGWPQAHEDDAVRAIRAALEVVDAVAKLTATAPMHARVGLHTGLVVVGETGQGDASIPKAAVGDTPNIAARLQAMAEPSSVVVSEHTKALSGGLFDCRDLGAHALKGISASVRLFQIRGLRAVESRFDATRDELALTPLVGRDEEVDSLMRRWARVKAGEGQAVLICGEPGIGKSRLVRALREQIATDEHTAVRYQCSPYYVNSALYPIIEQFERAARFTRDDTSEQKLDKMESRLLVGAGEVDESAALFAALLSLPMDRYPPLALSPQKQKERTLVALAHQVQALARQRPVLIVLEDAHWIDPTTQELFDSLIAKVQGIPLLILLTHRPEYRPAWIGEPNVASIMLSRWNRRQGADFVAKLTGGKAIPAEVLEQILTHTDGVPLFAEELTKSVLESKLMREVADRYVLDSPLSALAIPTTLRDSLVARLDRLAPIRELSQIGACIGREFAYELLSAIAPIQGHALDDALEQLTSSGLVFKRGTPPNATYTFKHALVQDAAYDSLLKSKRSQVHAQIARVLEERFPATMGTEPELLARHYTAAGAHNEALRYWLSAAQLASAQFANTEAIGHAKKGMEALQALPEGQIHDQQELLLQTTLAWALASAKGYGAGEVGLAFARARELCNRMGQTEPMFPILSGLWIYSLMRGKYADSGEIAEQLLALGERLQNSGILVSAHMAISGNCLFTGDFHGALTHADSGAERYDSERHAALAKDFGFDPGTLCVDWSAWASWFLGYPDQSQHKSSEALARAEKAGHPFTTATILVHNAIIAYFRNSPEAVIEHVRAAIAVCDQVGIPLRKAEAQILGGWALTQLDQPEKGLQELETGLSAWMQMGTEIANPIWFALLALAYQKSGRPIEARSSLSRALEVKEKNGERLWEAELHRLDAVFRIEVGEPSEHVEACLHKAIEVAQYQSAKSLELRASTSLARLWQGQNKAEQARDLLAPIYDWFTEGRSTNDHREAKALLDELQP